MERRAFVWTVERHRDNETLVTFAGDLDERCSLDAFPPVEGKVTFDLSGVTRVTSGGVTRWIKLLRRLNSVQELSLVRCSVAVVTQLNMVRGFQGPGVVRSFYAPYVCEASGEEEDVLLTPSQVPDPLNPPRLSRQSGEMVLNDLPRRYFAFLSNNKH